MDGKITVENVTVKRWAIVEGHLQSLTILKDVSFTLSPGGRLAIIGPSGTGKTSLLRLLNRLEDPAEGRVLLAGVDMRTIDPISVRRRVGMVFQSPFLFDLTVYENLAYPLSLMKQALPRERASALLQEVGLSEEYLDRRGQQLSGGQQQRIAIARALVLEPEVLLMDEPTSALDEESARIVMDTLLRRNVEEGLGLVLITHTREVLFRLACPTIVAHNSHIHEYPSPDEALESISRARIALE